MRILGIDPGIGRTGWGVIVSEKGKVRAEAYGCIETPAGQDIGFRLKTLSEQLKIIIEEYHPETLGIEDLFFNTNVKTAMVVGQARGVVLLTAAQHNLSVGVYTPPQVKVAVAGYGKADKTQVGQMVKTILKLPSIPKPDDTADALAIALTHAFSYRA